MASSKPNDASNPGFCEDCLKGFSFSGTPTGKENSIGPYKTVYVASDSNTKGGSAIVLLTDVFGFGLVNPKLIADKLHEATGFTVYVPDLFDGKPVAADALPMYQLPDDIRNKGFLGNVKEKLSIAGVVPWFISNRPATKMPNVKAFVGVLKKPKYGHTKIGTIGYCFGGKLGAELNAEGLTDATVLAHPSLITKADIDALKTPSTFALSELDHAFDESMTEYVQKTLKDKIPMEVVTYPGTVHGFASRGDLSVESVRKGSEGAMVQAVNWFKKYLAEEQIRLVQPSE